MLEKFSLSPELLQQKPNILNVPSLYAGVFTVLLTLQSSVYAELSAFGAYKKEKLRLEKENKNKTPVFYNEEMPRDKKIIIQQKYWDKTANNLRNLDYQSKKESGYFEHYFDNIYGILIDRYKDLIFQAIQNDTRIQDKFKIEHKISSFFPKFNSLENLFNPLENNQVVFQELQKNLFQTPEDLRLVSENFAYIAKYNDNGIFEIRAPEKLISLWIAKEVLGRIPTREELEDVLDYDTRKFIEILMEKILFYEKRAMKATNIDSISIVGGVVLIAFAIPAIAPSSDTIAMFDTEENSQRESLKYNQYIVSRELHRINKRCLELEKNVSFRLVNNFIHSLDALVDLNDNRDNFKKEKLILSMVDNYKEAVRNLKELSLTPTQAMLIEMLLRLSVEEMAYFDKTMINVWIDILKTLFIPVTA